MVLSAVPIPLLSIARLEVQGIQPPSRAMPIMEAPRLCQSHSPYIAGAVAAFAGGVVAYESRRKQGRAALVRAQMRATPDNSGTAAVKQALAAKEAEYQKRLNAKRGPVIVSDIPELQNLARHAFVGDDGMLQVPAAKSGVRASVFAIYAPDQSLQYIGVSRDSQKSLRTLFARRPDLCGEFAVFDVTKPDRTLLEATRKAWFQEHGMPIGNSSKDEQALWESPIDVRRFSSGQELVDEAALRDAVHRVESEQVEKFAERGCFEHLMFDTKMKAKGLLDLDSGAPIGIRRPEGGVAATYQVEMTTPEGTKVSLECPPDLTILEAAEEAGIELPSSCKSGACSACAGRVTHGVVDQSDQSYLDDAQLDAGYVLTCVCYPRSDLTLETGKQNEVA